MFVDCEVRGKLPKQSHALLTGVNKYLHVVSTFLFYVSEIWHKTSLHNPVQHM